MAITRTSIGADGGTARRTTAPRGPSPRTAGRRSWVARAGLPVLVIALTALPGSAQAATRAAPGPGAVPVAPARLPSRIEDPSPYLGQVSCDPTAKPGALALARMLVATYPGTSYGISRACGATDVPSEHYEGRAVDWMVARHDPRSAARVEALIGWLLAADARGHPFANARRLGVMYLIWDDRIWGSYAADAGWRPYRTCAEHPEPAWDTTCHRDHLHVSLSWAGAMGRTSFWTRSVAATDYGPCRPGDLNWAAPYRRPNALPCPPHHPVTAPDGAPPIAAELVRYSGATIAPGSTGPVVAAVQQALGVPATGFFGPLTAAAVTTFRRMHGLGRGTGLNAATWRALLVADAVPADAENGG